jgi:prepilin-type N-terminal cleavage/methylation domain-containing protein
MTDDGINARRQGARGLTLIEVVIAASILSIAAIAVLELFASSDAVGLAARRQALAAFEAERILESCAQAIKDGDALPPIASLQGGMQGEALAGCRLAITATDLVEDLDIPAPGPGGATRTVQITLRFLVATVESPEGDLVVRLERAVPID